MCCRWKDCTSLLDIGSTLTDRRDCMSRPNMGRMLPDWWKDCTSLQSMGCMMTDRNCCTCLPHTKCMRRMMCLRGKDCMFRLNNWYMLQLMCCRWRDCMSRLNMKRILTDQEKDCRYRLSIPCMLRLLIARIKGCTSPQDKQCTSQRSRPRSSTTRSDNRRWAQ